MADSLAVAIGAFVVFALILAAFSPESSQITGAFLAGNSASQQVQGAGGTDYHSNSNPQYSGQAPYPNNYPQGNSQSDASAQGVAGGDGTNYYASPSSQGTSQPYYDYNNYFGAGSPSSGSSGSSGNSGFTGSTATPSTSPSASAAIPTPSSTPSTTATPAPSPTPLPTAIPSPTPISLEYFQEIVIQDSETVN